ncbi:MAG: hypothetical protein ABL993_15265 [Vicinamibacterales bacterium]
MDLSLTHLHLLLNHFPTIGFIIGLGLFVIALIAGSEHLKTGSLVVLVGIALITIPTYITGNAGEEALCHVAGNTLGGAPTAPCTDPAVSRTLIEMHEGVAFLALIFVQVTGGFAWLALWQQRRFSRIPTWNTVLVLLLSVVALATVSRAASIGGEIRHPEIRVTQESSALPLARQVGNFIRDTPWTWVSAETLHFIGLTLLVGVVLLIDLKMLGFLPSIPYDTLDRMLPWAILGFGMNVVTGMLFFAAAAFQYTRNPAFYWKLAFILGAGLNTLLFTFDQGWSVEGRPALARSKVLAVTALFLWIGVMFWGSMLPFIGTAF